MLSLHGTEFVPKICVRVRVIEENGAATSYRQESLETEQWDLTPGKTCFSEPCGLRHKQALEMLHPLPREFPLWGAAHSPCDLAVSSWNILVLAHTVPSGLEEQIPVFLTVASLLRATFYVVFSLWARCGRLTCHRTHTHARTCARQERPVLTLESNPGALWHPLPGFPFSTCFK